MARTTTNNITGPKYGKAANGRDLPWDVMGEHLKPAHATDLDKALKAAGMDYDVEVWDSQATDPITGRVLPNPKGKQIVRPDADGSLIVIGQTGTRFTPTQNRDAFSIARELTELGASISGLADFRHGGASIMALDLGQPMVVNRRHTNGPTFQDQTDLYLLAKNHHDGSGALTFALTPIRVACTNALPAAIREAQQVWKIAHTPNAAERQHLVHDMIREAVGFREAFTVQAQAMTDQAMTDAEFAKIVAGMWPVGDDQEGAVAERKRGVQAEVVNLYRQSETLDNIRGTVWGGYNALTEYLDHYRPVRGGEDAAPTVRAEGQIDGPNVRMKRALWSKFAVA